MHYTPVMCNLMSKVTPIVIDRKNYESITKSWLPHLKCIPINQHDIFMHTLSGAVMQLLPKYNFADFSSMLYPKLEVNLSKE